MFVLTNCPIFAIDYSKRTEGTVETAIDYRTRSTAPSDSGTIPHLSTTLCAVSFRLLLRPWTTVSPRTLQVNSSSMQIVCTIKASIKALFIVFDYLYNAFPHRYYRFGFVYGVLRGGVVVFLYI